MSFRLRVITHSIRHVFRSFHKSGLRLLGEYIAVSREEAELQPDQPLEDQITYRSVEEFHSFQLKRRNSLNICVKKAEELAVKFAGQARAYAQLEHSLTEVDILITSTGARERMI